MVVVLACQATYAGEIDSFESILALLKSLKIRALENFCLLDIAITSHFYWLLVKNLCQTLIFIPNIDSSTEHR